MFKYFKIEDFDCQETGENEMSEAFIWKLDHLREICGFPFVITSGYRDPSHSIERDKPNGGGQHTKGLAISNTEARVCVRFYWGRRTQGIYPPRYPRCRASILAILTTGFILAKLI